MRRLFTIALLLATATGIPVVELHANSAASAVREARPAVHEDLILAAIRTVETGNDARLVGRRGERGAYQFRQSTWRQHTREPFALAHTGHADLVARRHFRWISENLLRAGRPADPFHVALAWNAGLSSAIRGTAPASSRNYARRVANLTESYASAMASR